MKLRFSPTRLLTLVFFFSLLMIASCKKENSQSTNAQELEASMASSESDGEAEMVFNDIFDDAIGVNDEVGMFGTGVFGLAQYTNPNAGVDVQRLTACYTVTVTHLNPPVIFPIRVVIDFGTAGCTGADGHVRKGKIITEYTGRLIHPGSIATTTFDGFYVDNIHVEGTHKITNTSSTNTSVLSRQFTVDIIDAKLSKPNGNFTEWSSHKAITQIGGLVTPDYPRDDVFRIEGTAHGRAKTGNLLVGWNASTIEPLIKRFDCRWITRGKIRTIRVNNTANSPWVAILDFDPPNAGDCDRLAVITINGIPHQITLH